MKVLVACCAAFALAACGSSSSSTSSTTGGSSGGATGTSGGGASTGGRTSSGGASSSAGATSTGAALGSDCDVSGGTDPCLQFALECTADTSTTTTTGTCELPGDLVNCDANSYGCQDGGSPQLDCSSGFQDQNGNPVDVCTLPCTHGSDCGPIYEGCVPSNPPGCFPQPCNQNANEGDTCGSDQFQTGSDGQCLSFGGGALPTCYQNGAVTEGMPCNPELRTGADGECEYGLFCVPNANGDGGLCYPITLDGGCLDTELALQGPTNPVWGPNNAADFGVCVTDCTVSQTCVEDGGSDAGLLGFGTCQLLSDGQTSACLP